MIIGKESVKAYEVSDGERSCRMGKRQYEALRAAVERLRETLEPQGILLFGSCARGQAGFTSDLDLYVLLPSVTKEGAMHRTGIVAELNADPGAVEIDAHFGTMQDLEGPAAFETAVRRDGIWVYRNDGELLKGEEGK